MKPQNKQKQKTEDKGTLRASIGFPQDLYRTLERMARQKKVSLAWVIREAAEKYVADQTPLFGNSEGNSRQ
jgi:metal-responsive CopG/Arc/MetJ family transcriptional regulator